VKKRIHRNWKLVRASWMALLRYRMLLVYPLLSTVVVSVVAGYLPLALVRARIAEEKAAFAFTPQGIIGFLILYIVTCTTVQFFNVMLVADAIARLDGPYRLRLRGWRVAGPRFPAIVAYAVLSSTFVSIPILVICRLARMVGIRSLPEPGAWSLATFLGVPVIAAEGLGTRPAMERSAMLLRATWGDTFVGGIGVLVVRIVVVFLAFIGGLGLLLLVTLVNYDPLSLAVAVLWLATFIFLFVTGSAVSMIYCTATYRHCIGRPVAGFEALYDIPGAVRPVSEVPDEVVQPGTVVP
jgi:hypothetical protein